MEPETSSEWRGRISATVEDHDRDISELKRSLESIRTEQVRTGTRVVTMRVRVDEVKTSVELLRGDLAESVTTMLKNFDDLRKGIAASRFTTKDLWKEVVFPVMTLTVAGLLVALIANGHL